MKYYTHYAFKDVFFELLHIIYFEHKVKIKIEWWNKSQTNNPFKLNIKTKHVINKDKWKEFVVYKHKTINSKFRDLY